MKNLLKMMRWEAGLKQYELAIQLHCSAPYLSLVENGRIDPPKEFKAKAAQFFKVGVEEIFPEAERVERTLIISTEKNELPNRPSHIDFGAYRSYPAAQNDVIRERHRRIDSGSLL